MKSIKKILVVGDSLAFGRPKHRIFYDDTWPRLIESDGHKVFHRGRGGADSKLVLNELRQLDSYMIDGEAVSIPFDVCIIQVGIVDCTPRLLSSTLQKIINYLPRLNKFIARLSKYQLLNQYLGTQWVNLESFEKNIIDILQISDRLAIQVVVIEIAKPMHFLIENCGDFSYIVNQYNAILRKISSGRYLAVYDELTFNLGDMLLPDGHHLTKLGHQIVANKILEVV